MPWTGSATTISRLAARAMDGCAIEARPNAAVDFRNFRLFMASSLLHSRSRIRSLPHAFAQPSFQPRHRRIHHYGQGREDQHRHPHQRDIVGLAGIEDSAGEAVLGGDELADDGAGTDEDEL